MPKIEIQVNGGFFYEKNLSLFTKNNECYIKQLLFLMIIFSFFHHLIDYKQNNFYHFIIF